MDTTTGSPGRLAATPATIDTARHQLREAEAAHRKAEAAVADTREALYAAIRAASAAGVGPTQVAALAGVSRQMVHRIIRNGA